MSQVYDGTCSTCLDRCSSKNIQEAWRHPVLCDWHFIHHLRHSLPHPPAHNDSRVDHLQNALQLLTKAVPRTSCNPMMPRKDSKHWSTTICRSPCKLYATLTRKYIGCKIFIVTVTGSQYGGLRLHRTGGTSSISHGWTRQITPKFSRVISDG